jgi:hypothetical protein
MDERAFTLEQRLFHGLHHVKAPSVKEFKEAWEFCAAVRGTISDDVRVVMSANEWAGGGACARALCGV